MLNQLFASHDQFGNGISDPVTEEHLSSGTPLVITLQSPGSIFRIVFDSNENPIEKVDVILTERRRGIAYQTQSNSVRIYSFDDIPLITKGESEEQNTHTIQFRKYGYETISMDVILYPAEINTRDVILQTAASIAGQVFDAANNPLPEGRYSLVFYVQNDQTQFPIMLGSLPFIEVKRNQETDVGNVLANTLIPII